MIFRHENILFFKLNFLDIPSNRFLLLFVSYNFRFKDSFAFFSMKVNESYFQGKSPKALVYALVIAQSPVVKIRDAFSPSGCTHLPGERELWICSLRK